MARTSRNKNMQLLILDVDGTLVQSLEAEGRLFPRACEQALGLTEVTSDWDSYRCPSDRGIVRELVERQFDRQATSQEYAQVEQHFLALIQEEYRQHPDSCRPVAGAVEALLRFRQMPDVALSIATAGWHSTAMHKLSVAGFCAEDIPIATSQDAEEKADIMRIAKNRAATRYGVSDFESVVCFGDSAGDARAALQLGFDFIAIDTSGFVADAVYRHADFDDLDGILATLRGFQAAARPSETSE